MPTHSPMAPFYVMRREAERDIVRAAITASRSHSEAAELLGVSSSFLGRLARSIGGFMKHPVYEPPKPISGQPPKVRP